MENEEKNGKQLLAEGLETILSEDDFREAFKKISDAAYAEIFQAQGEGKLVWKRSGEELSDFVTEAIVKNGRGQEITIPVILYSASIDEGHNGCFLMLGSKKNSPCRNDADPQVRLLYQQITGKSWKSH